MRKGAKLRDDEKGKGWEIKRMQYGDEYRIENSPAEFGREYDKMSLKISVDKSTVAVLYEEVKMSGGGGGIGGENTKF